MAPAANQRDQLYGDWRIRHEVGLDIIKLALFDIIVYADNSGAIEFRENMRLKLILSRVTYAASLFDGDGI